MPAAIGQVLTAEQRTLRQMRAAIGVAQRTTERADILRLKAQGRNWQAIAEIFACHEHTVTTFGTLASKAVRRQQGQQQNQEQSANGHKRICKIWKSV